MKTCGRLCNAPTSLLRGPEMAPVGPPGLRWHMRAPWRPALFAASGDGHTLRGQLDPYGGVFQDGLRVSRKWSKANDEGRRSARREGDAGARARVRGPDTDVPRSASQLRARRHGRRPGPRPRARPVRATPVSSSARLLPDAVSSWLTRSPRVAPHPSPAQRCDACLSSRPQ